MKSGLLSHSISGADWCCFIVKRENRCHYRCFARSSIRFFAVWKFELKCLFISCLYVSFSGREARYYSEVERNNDRGQASCTNGVMLAWLFINQGRMPRDEDFEMAWSARFICTAHWWVHWRCEKRSAQRRRCHHYVALRRPCAMFHQHDGMGIMSRRGQA